VALDGMIFKPSSNYNGLASIQIVTNDRGFSGTPLIPLQKSDTVSITITAVNDAPLNGFNGQPITPGVNPSVNTDEDTPLIFNAAYGNQLQIADVDALGNSQLQVTLTA